MKKLLVFLFVLSLVSICQAKTIEVKTGFGYFSDSNGNIICKANLPAGEHLCKDEYTYTEVQSQAELNNVQVYQTPPTDKQIKEQLIQQKIREQAISELKKEGKLDNNEKPVK